MTEDSSSCVVRQLLAGIIDYAGLFPPASLALPETTANFVGYTTHAQAWMLARLVVPAGKLAALQWPAGQGSGQPSLPVSVLMPGIEPDAAAFDLACSQVAQNQQRTDRVGDAVAIETRADSREGFAQAAERIDQLEGCATAPVFWELPHDRPVLGELIEAIRQRRRSDFKAGRAVRYGAKIRTGGVEAKFIPPVDQVARFIHACALARVPFKATAGLHHPVRGDQPLTCQPDAPRGVMHGFLNVFLAAAAAWEHGAPLRNLETMLAVEDPAAFRIEGDTIAVAGYRLTASQLQRTRTEFALAFGSCSFVEPVDDLVRMGWPLNR
jgi:hypothetical protein